jgi:hypothetical protein
MFSFRISVRLLFLRFPLAFLALRLRMLSLGLLFLRLPLFLVLPHLLLMPLNLGPLLILLLPLMSYFLSLVLRSRLITLDVPSSFPFPVTITIPVLPVTMKSLVRNSFVIPLVSVPIMVSVVSSPPRVYIVVKPWDTVVISPAPIIIM